jgi:hypothetical protein
MAILGPGAPGGDQNLQAQPPKSLHVGRIQLDGRAPMLGQRSLQGLGGLEVEHRIKTKRAGHVLELLPAVLRRLQGIRPEGLSDTAGGGARR